MQRPYLQLIDQKDNKISMEYVQIFRKCFVPFINQKVLKQNVTGKPFFVLLKKKRDTRDDFKILNKILFKQTLLKQ